MYPCRAANATRTQRSSPKGQKPYTILKLYATQKRDQPLQFISNPNDDYRPCAPNCSEWNSGLGSIQLQLFKRCCKQESCAQTAPCHTIRYSLAWDPRPTFIVLHCLAEIADTGSKEDGVVRMPLVSEDVSCMYSQYG